MGICCGKKYDTLHEEVVSEKKVSPDLLAQHIKITTPHDDVTKSAEDKRRYCGLELTNGMKIVLISDPLADKSAVSMDVNIGYYSDPKELPGLAHFCEHMLFLGSKKYEEENEFDKFLSEHGGCSNAYTDGEHTNYYCDVSPLHLHGALERFAQFFLCPLFTSSGTEREVNAVNSENDANLQEDSNRLYQLDVSQADPNHDFNRFGTGNKETLETIPKSKGINVRDELLKFHSKYYSSNVMGLCVLGKESISELIDMVVPLFADVENKNIIAPEWTQHPFGPDQLKGFTSDQQLKVIYGRKKLRKKENQTICYAVPIKDFRSLTMVWSIPDLHSYYTTKPGSYVGHLIGHEARGSLLHELKERGWVNFLSAGVDDGAKGFMFFSVDVDLTIEGQEHVDDIVTLTYQYINLVRTHGIQEWIFKECQDLRSMMFHFKDKEQPVDYVSTISNRLCFTISKVTINGDKIVRVPNGERYRPYEPRIHIAGKGVIQEYIRLLEYPMAEVLSAPRLISDFRPDVIQMLLDKLIPENMRICVVSQKFKDVADSVEKWYGTQYKLERMSDEKLQVNSFIRLWFKQDDTFLLPKACINFRLYRCLARLLVQDHIMTIYIESPIAYADPKKCNMSTLLEMLFDDAINEYAYVAELSGLYYDFSYTRHGLDLSVAGYSEKQPMFLKMLLEKLTNFQVDPKRFPIFKEMLTRRLKNFQAAQPYDHSNFFTTAVLCEPQWTKEEKLKALEDITAEGLQGFIPQLLTKLYVEGLIEGNMTKQRAVDIANIVLDGLQKPSKTEILPPSEITHLREIQLPYGSHYLYKRCNSVHKSSCVEIYYQCGVQDTKLNMLLELLEQIMDEPCYDILRTKEQLGYNVCSEVRSSDAVCGLSITVQSDNSPDFIEDRIEAFISSMEIFLDEMAQETFTKHVDSLVTSRLEKPKNIYEEHCQHWSEIDIKQYNFDRDNIEVAYVQTLTKEDVLTFFKENIAADAPKRRKLSVHIISTADDEITAIEKLHIDDRETSSESRHAYKPHLITDIREFKEKMELFPPPKPYVDLEKSSSAFCED